MSARVRDNYILCMNSNELQGYLFLWLMFLYGRELKKLSILEGDYGNIWNFLGNKVIKYRRGTGTLSGQEGTNFY